MNRGIIKAQVLVLLFAAATAYASLRTDVEVLTRQPHRLSGTSEYAEAAQYVEDRLRAIGIEQVMVQEFPTAQVVVRQCEMVWSGGTIPLSPGRPNGIMPPSTPVEGITGELVDLGDASDDALNRVSVRGRIVVMDYNAETQWLKAFQLGARAVIIVNGVDGDSYHHHHLRANANLPRYYFEGAREELPTGETVTLHAQMTWEQVVGRNVIAYLPGTDPVFDLGREEAILIGAHLDSFGEFPMMSPGARGAANVAGLLELAEIMQNNRPRRHVVLAFFDQQARSHAGVVAFYWALEERMTEATIRTRMESWEEEQRFIHNIAAIMARDNPLAHLHEEGGRRLGDRINNRAGDMAQRHREVLMDLREEANALSNDPDKEALARVIAQIESEQYVFNRWNELRRALNRGRAVDTDLHDLLDRVLEAVRKDIALRRAELEREGRMLQSSEALHAALHDKWITLHVSMLLGDATPRWGVFIGGDSDIRSRARDQAGLYGRVQQSFLRAYLTLEARNQAPRGFERATVDATLSQPRLLWAARGLIHGGEVAGRYGIYNIALGTVHETLPREGTPADTMEHLNLEQMHAHVQEMARILTAIGDQDAQVGAVEAVADQRGLSLRRVIPAEYAYVVPHFRRDTTEGARALGRYRGSATADRPLADTVIQVNLINPWNRVFWEHTKYAAFDPFIVVMTDQNGAYTIGGLPRDGTAVRPVSFAALFNDRGHVVEASDMRSRDTLRSSQLLFASQNAHYFIPPRLWPGVVNVYAAVGNANLGGASSDRGHVQALDGVVTFFVEEKVSDVKVFGLRGAIALDNDGIDLQSAAMHDALGRGFPVDGAWYNILPTFQGAGDLWRLNESRLALLRSRDILNSSLEELHGRVEDLYTTALETEEPLYANALAGAALLSAEPVYERSRAIMDDLVAAVLILLALCIPFAYSLERLLIGASMIYKQVSWFTVFFLMTFGILYVSHPAFAVAQTPIIIFLGFAVVVLSSLVIFIIMQKFEAEIKALQGMTSTVHVADISRFNTVMAAMSMGISTMRRRPLRTALTAVTIVLLTFTILCFASFDTQRGIVRLFIAPSPGYTGVLYYPPTRGAINADYVDFIRARWSRDAAVTTRHWVCPETRGDPDFVVSLADGSNPVTLRGILGIEPEELRRRADLRSLLHIDDPSEIENKVFMTDAVGSLLGVEPGDQVLVKGLRLTVSDFISAPRFTALTDMDSSSIIPIDYGQMQETQAGQSVAAADEIGGEQVNWANLPTDSVVIMADHLCKRVGGKASLIHLYTDQAADAVRLAEDFARMMDRSPILATRQDGVYRHVLGTVVAASGVGDLLFPVLLGGLVIFGTMLGSVADREKEIYTFSALGLAPPHVASLFFAEALVYSVLGGMGGYLIAQGTMKILTGMAAFGWVTVPEINYSSTNAIVTILIVMATVLISAIYPAYKASKSANPGLLRTWRPPPPNGDVYDIVFPFTVSEYDLTGVVSFLKEHFENFSDTGLGAFMAQNTEMVQYEDGQLGLKAQLALAPFDLGVTQDFELRSSPSEIKGIDEVNIRLIRHSGQPGDWVRLNRNLFDDLRTQFLLWRSIPKEVMEYYREQTLMAIKENKQTRSPATSPGDIRYVET